MKPARMRGREVWLTAPLYLFLLFPGSGQCVAELRVGCFRRLPQSQQCRHRPRRAAGGTPAVAQPHLFPTSRGLTISCRRRATGRKTARTTGSCMCRARFFLERRTFQFNLGRACRRNSWDVLWGEKGYIKLLRSDNPVSVRDMLLAICWQLVCSRGTRMDSQVRHRPDPRRWHRMQGRPPGGSSLRHLWPSLRYVGHGALDNCVLLSPRHRQM
jgi:hypothetical protein